jgi:hypothetical protein
MIYASYGIPRLWNTSCRTVDLNVDMPTSIWYWRTFGYQDDAPQKDDPFDDLAWSVQGQQREWSAPWGRTMVSGLNQMWGYAAARADSYRCQQSSFHSVSHDPRVAVDFVICADM